jgi:hypothetical protein
MALNQVSFRPDFFRDTSKIEAGPEAQCGNPRESVLDFHHLELQ